MFPAAPASARPRAALPAAIPSAARAPMLHGVKDSATADGGSVSRALLGGLATSGSVARRRTAVRRSYFVLQALLLAFLLPSNALAFDSNSMAQTALELMRDGPYGPAPFMLLHCAAIVACFPGTAAFELTAGAVFGFLPGVAVVAATKGAAAAVTFGIARRASNLVPRGVLPTAAGEWGARVRRGVQRDAFRFCLLARLSPIPSWVNNYALPLSDVPFQTFLPATLLGMIPPAGCQRVLWRLRHFPGHCFVWRRRCGWSGAGAGRVERTERRSHSAADGVVRVGRPAMTQKKTCGKQQSLQGGDMGTY
ncbi:unnamed protein product [Durusdinium trenchii]|uniref:VTT domain-containing protein n=1 Tax=Durusdinium trenchii TaxID=1381693 RepID=A0ABP0HW85_9DINO